MPQFPFFKPWGERIPQGPKIPQRRPQEKPASPFERKTYIKKEDVRRWAKWGPQSYEMLKEIWKRYTDKREKTLNDFFQKYWGEKEYLTKKDYEQIKKKLDEREKWSSSWEEKNEIGQIKKFLEKFEKDFPA